MEQFARSLTDVCTRLVHSDETTGDDPAPADRAVLTDGGVQAGGPDGGASQADGSAGLAGTMAPLSVHDLLDWLPMPVFMLDSDHTVVAWNYGTEALYGRSREEVLGSDEYMGRDENGNPVPTLADRVIESPRSLPADYDAELRDSPWVEEQVVTGTATIKTASGEPRHFRMVAVPVFEDDELLGVVQYFEDRTEVVRRQEATDAAVDEITSTLAAIGDGDLSARVSLDDTEGEYLDDHLLDVIEGVNNNARALEALVDQVQESTGELTDLARETADLAADIADAATIQAETLEESVGEMSDFSATMEEVAANADSVADAAEAAKDAADDGRAASRQARDALEGVTEQGGELIDAVTALEDRMTEVDEVVSIIDDIAERTNMLALNANIEAARAADGSEGFAVVAEEVKQLAEQTKTRTDEIAGHVDDIQTQTAQTTATVEETDARIEASQEPVDEALSAIEEIATSVEEVSQSIQEVAKANDDQAATAEEVAAAIDDVQQRAESVEETSTAIHDLADEQRDTAEHLAERVNRISTDSA